MSDKKLEWETASMMSAVKRKQELQKKEQVFESIKKHELSERKAL